MLRKMSIVPVMIIALLLFSSNTESRDDETLAQVEQMSALAIADVDSKIISEDSGQKDEELVLFALVEIKPTFNGKDAEVGFREYIRENTNYPAAVKENGISGCVYVEFTIEKDGSVTDVKLLRGVNPLLDAEALRVIKASPKWMPGKHEGKLVKVKYKFPIYFIKKG